MLSKNYVQTLSDISFSNPEKVTKIVTSLNLKIPPRDLKSKETKQLLGLIFSQWLSLSSCIIQSVIDVVPPPSTAQRTRIPKMLYPDLYETTIEPKNKLEENLYSCDASPDACVTALVSKMFAVPTEELPENKKKPATAEELRAKARAAREARKAAESGQAAAEVESTPLEVALEKMRVEEPTGEEKAEGGETLLGFARIYSGTIRKGTTIAAILPKYHHQLDPKHPKNERHLVQTEVEALYVMMGRELVPVDCVRAGNVFAIKGLEGKVWRNATLCAPGEDGIGENTDLAGLKDCLVNLGGVARMVSMALYS